MKSISGVEWNSMKIVWNKSLVLDSEIVEKLLDSKKK